MTIPEILKELEPYTGKFPMEAMRAAIQQREAITPELLRVMESVAAAPAEWAARKNNVLPLFTIFLLAQFREKAAYPHLVKIVSAPGEIPFDLFGDAVTEAMNRILASVYDGNPALLQGLIESEQVNDFVRSAALRTFLVLEHTGQMPREAVVHYFRSLFHGKLQRTPSYAWSSLACAVADLPAPEFLEDVRQAYADGLVDTMVADLEGIERHLNAPPPWRKDRQHLITDAIAELEPWAAFHPVDSRPKKLPKVESPVMASKASVPDSEPHPAAPPPKVHKKPSRNARCPCGSGKRYKNCCGKQ